MCHLGAHSHGLSSSSLETTSLSLAPCSNDVSGSNLVRIATVFLLPSCSLSSILSYKTFQPCGLGENISTDDDVMNETTVCIGDVYQLGSAKLEVRGDLLSLARILEVGRVY